MAAWVSALFLGSPLVNGAFLGIGLFYLLKFSSSHRHQMIPVCPRFLFWLAVLSVTAFPVLTGLTGVFLLPPSLSDFLLQRINFDASVLALKQFNSVLCEHTLL